MTKKKYEKKDLRTNYIRVNLTDKEKELISLGSKIDERNVADYVRHHIIIFSKKLLSEDVQLNLYKTGMEQITKSNALFDVMNQEIEKNNKNDSELENGRKLEIDNKSLI